MFIKIQHVADRTKYVVSLAVDRHERFIDVTIGYDTESLLTLHAAHRLGVEAVGDGGVATAHEGGAFRDAILARCRFNVFIGSIERIGDGDGLAVIPAHEATTVIGAFGGEQAASVGTARDIQRTSRHGHETAVGTVQTTITTKKHTFITRIVRAAMDDCANLATLNICSAIAVANKTTGKLPGCIDVARYLEVAEGGILDIAEGGAAVLAEMRGGRAFREGQRVNTVAEEGALERVGLAGTQHFRHADVGSQLHKLASVAIAEGHVKG